MATDPFTGNRYSFAGGNPISNVELDGHGWYDWVSGIGHTVLDVAGFVPVIGEAADLVNAAWSGVECAAGYDRESSCVDAGLGLAAAIPFAGWGAGAAKIGKRAADAVDSAVDSAGDAAKRADAPPPPHGTPDAPASGQSGAPSAAKPDAPSGGKPGGSPGGPGSGPAPARAPDAPAPPARAESCPVPNSFVAGTRVLMADGTSKPIERLKAGDRIRATDPETGDTRSRTVLDTISGKGRKNLVRISVESAGKAGAGSGVLVATEEHPFWIPDAGRWRDAKDLRPGTWLRTSAGVWVRVTAVDEVVRNRKVHNLTTAGTHTYYVEAGDTPVLVHNCGPTKDDALLARARADEIQSSRDDYPNANRHGTTSVMGIFNTETRKWSIRIAINGEGSLPSGALRAGEEFVQGAGHAEETILNALGRNEVVGFGGTTRNICEAVCYRLLNSRGMRFGGQGDMGGLPDKTPFSLFWSEGW